MSADEIEIEFEGWSEDRPPRVTLHPLAAAPESPGAINVHWSVWHGINQMLIESDFLNDEQLDGHMLGIAAQQGIPDAGTCRKIAAHIREWLEDFDDDQLTLMDVEGNPVPSDYGDNWEETIGDALLNVPDDEEAPFLSPIEVGPTRKVADWIDRCGGFTVTFA